LRALAPVRHTSDDFPQKEGATVPARSGPRRRAVIAAIPAAAVLASGGCTSPQQAEPRTLRFFTGHQAAVVEDATARIAPGPRDDPAEKGHPGAREADVTGYIDTMLGALESLQAPQAPQAPQGTNQPPMIFAGGPWSNRHTSGPDLMVRFAALDPVARIAWRKRLAAWRDQYVKGIAALDKLAGGDFTKTTRPTQDKVLATPAVSGFLSLLFEHTIEGLYSAPEYGGNRGLAGWKDIGFPGDIQPRGYTAAEVERSDGPDPVDNTGIVADVQRRRAAPGGRRRDHPLGRQGAQVLGPRLRAAVRARSGAGRRRGRLAVPLLRHRAVLRRGGAAHRRPGRRHHVPRHRDQARPPRHAVPDAAGTADALVARGGRGRHRDRPAPVPVPDGGQLDERLQRPARVQQLRVLQQLRLPGGGQAFGADPAASGAAHKGG
jgi:Gluconate 2-dehydrogenase subunit 3